jgi:hypothetical protein
MAFSASVDTVKNTTKELCSVTAQYAIGNEATQLHLALSSSGGSIARCHHLGYRGGRQEEAQAVPSGDRTHDRRRWWQQ